MLELVRTPFPWVAVADNPPDPSKICCGLRHVPHSHEVNSPLNKSVPESSGATAGLSSSVFPGVSPRAAVQASSGTLFQRAVKGRRVPRRVTQGNGRISPPRWQGGGSGNAKCDGDSTAKHAARGGNKRMAAAIPRGRFRIRPTASTPRQRYSCRRGGYLTACKKPRDSARRANKSLVVKCFRASQWAVRGSNL